MRTALRRRDLPPLVAETVALSDLTLEELPGIAREIASVIGLAQTLALIGNYGGRTLRLPDTRDRHGNRHATLAAWIGGEAAGALIGRFAGCDLYIPMATRALNLRRHRAMRRAYDAGYSIMEIAGAYGCADKSVWLAMKKAD
jgi:hypothetical protein